MAQKRVIAYFMHESEEAAARAAMPSAEQTESYLVGNIEESEIPRLQREGLIIQEVGEPSRESLRTELELVHGSTRIAKRAATTMASVDATAPPPTPPLPAGPAFYLVRLRGPLVESWRQRLSGMGVEFLESLATDVYKARLTSQHLRDLSTDTEMVANIRLYGAADTGPDVLQPSAAAPTAGVSMLTFDIRLHRSEDAPAVLSWLGQKQVAIAGASGRKIRVYLLEDSPLLDEIRDLPEVAATEQYLLPKLHNSNARRLLGLDPPGAGAGIGLEGAGQIVGIADTGLDDAHPDLANRIVGLVALGRPNDPSDPNGHGTHVAGSIAGDGSASGGRIRGTAPRAQIFFQSIMDAKGDLGGLPIDLNQLFEEAYQNGARVHNNSWGSCTTSMYVLSSSEVDEFVAGHRDMLIVISAGNEGDASHNRNATPGFVDWLSIDSPASCKNALTVGASCNECTNGGYSSFTWGLAWPNRFPAPPVASASISGHPDTLAAFSSRGPCDDRRIKPDVVAPGTDVASAKSSRAPLAWISTDPQIRVSGALTVLGSSAYLSAKS
jgi:serine protease AprX